jgi:hypothetical protein
MNSNKTIKDKKYFTHEDGHVDWHQWNREGNTGFWNAIRFFAEMKIGDTVPSWFNDNSYSVRDEGGWWFLTKLVLLGFTAIIGCLLGFIYMALHHVEGWISFGCLAGAVGIFFLVPIAWRMVFNAVDKAQTVKETISKLEAVVEESNKASSEA